MDADRLDPDAPQQRQCPTHLLPDDPSDQDDFGPHRELAEAIADLVGTEPGGRAIGLSGKWGAGKSTVIQLLKARLGNRRNHRVWVFDAWAHEGDPLRRTFLESLIRHLQGAGWIATRGWDERLEELARRRRVTEQRTFSNISPLGWTMAMLLALGLPLGSALFSRGLEIGVTSSPGPVNWPFWLGVGFVLLPLLAVALYVMCVEASYWLQRLRQRKPMRPNYNTVLAIVSRESDRSTRIESIETPEPTSIEFESVFSDLMAEALADRSRRLVLVVDNLDRIEARGALTIWSTLQTFLHQNSAPWLSQLWVVTPFDGDSIRLLWKAEEPDGGLASAFLDKSFQVRFEVPAPLLSDWRKYLLEALHSALPTHKDDEFHTIYRLVAAHFTAGHERPTPRTVKLIVNQIGALHRQRQHAVALPLMAYHVLLQRRGENVVDELLAGSLPEPGEAGLLGENAQEGLAALAVGVEPHRAQQVLLGTPVLRALGDGDGQRLRGLQEASSAFPEILETAVQQAASEWPRAEGGRILHALVALEELESTVSWPSYRLGGIRRVLFRAAGQTEMLAPLSDLTEAGLEILGRRCEDAALVRRAFAAYTHALGLASGEQAEAHVPFPALKLMEALDHAGHANAYAEGVPVPGAMDGYVRMGRALTGEDAEPLRKFWSLLRPQATDQVAVESLAQAVKGGEFSGEHLVVVGLLRDRGGEFPWGLLTGAVLERLGERTLATREVASLLDALLLFGDESLVQGVLDSLAAEGPLPQLVEIATDSGDSGALARCIYIFGLRAGTLPRTRPLTQAYQPLRDQFSAADQATVAGVAGLVLEHNNREWPFVLMEHEPSSRPFVLALLQRLAAGQHSGGYFVPQVIIEHWKDLADTVDLDLLISQVDAEGAVGNRLATGDLDPAQAELLARVVRAGADNAPLRGWCAAQLQQLTEGNWLSQLKENGMLLQLGLACLARRQVLGLKQPLRAALCAMATEVLDGTCPLPAWVERAEEVYALLSEADGVVARRKLYDLLKSNPKAVPGDYLRLCGDELIGQLREDSRLVQDLVEPWVTEHHLPGLTWLEHHLERDKGLLNGVSSEDQQVLRDDIARALQETPDDQLLAVLKRIAQHLHVPMPESTSTEGADMAP